MYVRYIHNVVLIVYSVPVFGSGTSGGLSTSMRKDTQLSIKMKFDTFIVLRKTVLLTDLIKSSREIMKRSKPKQGKKTP